MADLHQDPAALCIECTTLLESGGKDSCQARDERLAGLLDLGAGVGAESEVVEEFIAAVAAVADAVPNAPPLEGKRKGSDIATEERANAVRCGGFV
jgi:hypothetical protein